MRIFKPTTPFLALAAAMAAAGGARAELAPTGVWIDDTGRGGIEIADCGGKLCGHLVWFRDSAELKNCGKQILGDAEPVGRGAWDNGWIYSPEKKQKFDLELKPLSADRLQVMGYAGMKFLSKTMIWTRAPADLARCDAGKSGSASAAAPAPPKPETSARITDRALEPASEGPDKGKAPHDQVARAEAPPARDKTSGKSREPRFERTKCEDGDKTAQNEKLEIDVPFFQMTLVLPCKD